MAVEIDANDALLDRYRKNYGLGEDITIDHVLKHWKLERELTERLLASTPATRWATFSQCYTELYTRLPWLNGVEDDSQGRKRFSSWEKLLAPNSSVFEIGSGQASLLKYLVAKGHRCVATEITSERGTKHLTETSGVTWHLTDGVHLSQFEPRNCYDVVISTQVVEHFHPDDLPVHFREVLQVLQCGGRYIFDTPHRGSGPHDLSGVMGLEKAVCMHLKEYDFHGLGELLREAGFRKVRAVFFQPRLLRRPIESMFLFQICNGADRIFGMLRLPTKLERRLRHLVRRIVPENIWLSAMK